LKLAGTRRLPFWLTPKWVVGHVVCLALVVAFVNLGFWQLRRLHEKQQRRDLIEARMHAPPVPLPQLVRPDQDPTPVEYRQVVATGEWEPGTTTLVRARSLDERPGYLVLTVLRLPDGSGVVVNRGFAPLGGGGDAAAHAAPARSADASARGTPPATSG
jgi:cytochrome oxidase assembly protein ShyY1